MSLSDEIEVRIAGNLCQPITLSTRDGTTLATTIIGASPIALVGGQMDETSVYLPLEVQGAANAAAFAARAGVGSRVILRGRLEHRPITGGSASPRVDQEGMIGVQRAREELVVVVERLLSVAPPTGHWLEEQS